jgi:hypothetical protein
VRRPLYVYEHAPVRDERGWIDEAGNVPALDQHDYLLESFVLRSYDQTGNLLKAERFLPGCRLPAL